MILLLSFLLASPALAVCPESPDTSELRAQLHTRLLRAANELSAQRIANQLWQIWLTAPDEKAQILLDHGMERREAYDLEESERVFDQLILYCPAYPEGYNQRAFTRFLRNDFDGSLEDLAKVLEQNPYHFGALSGRALNLMSQGRMQLAQDALRAALKVHPFLRERSFLIEDPGKDI
ncbi:tetratricopeptide repeat protein [Oceanibium sediminis]|uniref:tetratricopeptide repeat protein n=1 Tax=Oceanibium sediminis TaxID=2026339 RepID=UPI001E2D7609|nr:hypothetical protein [Oceanibium sediminis]